MSELETAAVPWSVLPKGDQLTPFDRTHLAIYLSLLHASGEGFSSDRMAREILGLSADLDPVTSRSIVEAHLSRARWLANRGYKLLLEDRPSDGIASA